MPRFFRLYFLQSLFVAHTLSTSRADPLSLSLSHFGIAAVIVILLFSYSFSRALRFSCASAATITSLSLALCISFAYRADLVVNIRCCCAFFSSLMNFSLCIFPGHACRAAVSTLRLLTAKASCRYDLIYRRKQLKPARCHLLKYLFTIFTIGSCYSFCCWPTFTRLSDYLRSDKLLNGAEKYAMDLNYD